MADSNVIDLNLITRLDIAPDRVLQRALDASLTEVVVIGLCPEGQFWFASSKSDGGDVLWHLEIAKKRLLDIMDTNPAGYSLDPPGAG